MRWCCGHGVVSEAYVRNVGEFTHATAYQNIWARQVTVLGKRLGSLQEWESHQRNTHAAFVQFVQHITCLASLKLMFLNQDREQSRGRTTESAGALAF